MLSFTISYLDLIKFADTTERGDRLGGESKPKGRVWREGDFTDNSDFPLIFQIFPMDGFTKELVKEPAVYESV
jgi:hypothetical protein